MDLDDLDIYEDLDTFQKEEEKKTAELLSLEAKYNDSLKTIETLQLENAELKKQIRRIGINFQNLLDTAKAEIKRKDKQIEQLRKEKDDICFRRKQPRREYTDAASITQNTNVWFKNESVLPTNAFGSSTNANVQSSNETVEPIANEQPCTSGRGNTQKRDEYKKSERRNERSDRKHDDDHQREKYNRSKSQRDQHESRHRARSNERDGNARSSTRDYSRSYDSRTADRSRRDERDFRNTNKHYMAEKEKESYNSTENGRRQHSYDRLSDRSTYHNKEEKTTPDSYDGRHDRRSVYKEEKTKFASHDGRPSRRSDIKNYREDTIKKSKETNEKGCENVTHMNKNEVVTCSKNLDGHTKSIDMRRKPSIPSDSGSANKSNERLKLKEGCPTGMNSNETVANLDFLGKNLPASKDFKNLKKTLAEEKLTMENLLTVESEFSCAKTDKNANRLMSANYSDTNEPTSISNTDDPKNTESAENCVPINGDQNKHNKNDISADNNITVLNGDLTVEAKPQILNDTSKNQTAYESSCTKIATGVKIEDNKEDYAKIATIILSDDEYQDEVEQAVGTVSIFNSVAVYNENKTNGITYKGGIKILENIRLPNIYEIRAHQRRLREAVAAKKAKRALTAKTKETPSSKMVATAPERVQLERNTTTAGENNKEFGQQEEYVEAKVNQDERSLGSMPKINASISTDSMASTCNNQKTIEESRPETINTADPQSMENVNLSDKNVATLLTAAAIIETEEKSVNTNNIAVVPVSNQLKSCTTCIDHQNKTEQSVNSNNIEKPEENTSRESEEISTKDSEEETNVDFEKTTVEITSNKADTNDFTTVEVVDEVTNYLNEATSDQTLSERNIKSAVELENENQNKKDQCENLRRNSSTDGEQTSTHKDMPESNLLTKVMADDSDPKNSTIESNKNISELKSVTEAEQTSTHKDMPESNLLAKVLADDSDRKNSTTKSNENISELKSVTEAEQTSTHKDMPESNLLTKVLADDSDRKNSTIKLNTPTDAEQTSTHKDMPESNLLTKVLTDDSEQKNSTINVNENISKLKSVTEAEQTSTNKDMPNMQSSLLTKVISVNCEQKEIIVESKENTPTSQTLDENSDEVSKIKKATENNTVIAPVEEESEKLYKHNLDTEQEASSELKKVDEDQVVLTPEVDRQESKKLFEPIKSENESMSKNPKNNCDIVLSKYKRAENDRESHGVASAQKTVEQSEVDVTEPNTTIQPTEVNSEKLLETTETNTVSSSVIETCFKESNEIVVSDVTKSILNVPERLSESSTKIELSNDNNSTITKIDRSALTENDTNTNPVAIEMSEITISKDFEGKKCELHETEDVVPYFNNNKNTLTNSFLEENETKSEVQNVPNIDPKSVAKSKDGKINTKPVKSFSGDRLQNQNPNTKPKQLLDTVNTSAKRNAIVENIKRAEILWKFKIPKITAKRKREESADDPSLKESKNTGSDAVKREKLCNNVEPPLNPHKKKKSAKIVPKQMQEETKVLAINANVEKNLLETKTLFEEQKKSERIIREIDNWARRKVGEKTDILETEIQTESEHAHKKFSSKHDTLSNKKSEDEIPTNMKMTDNQNAHRYTKCESLSNDLKGISENQEHYKKPQIKQTSPCDKGDETQMKAQKIKIQERRKSHSKVEPEDHTHGSKSQNVKCDVETHREKSQSDGANNDKCKHRVVTTVQGGEVQTRKVENSENESNSFNKSTDCGDLQDKSKKSSHTTIGKKNITVKKELQGREAGEKYKKCSNTETTISKSQAEVTTLSKITNIKSDCRKYSPETLDQKRKSDENGFLSKTKSIEKTEREECYEKNVKCDVIAGKKENVQKESGKKVSSTEMTQLSTSAHGSLEGTTIANGSNTETTKYDRRIAATFAQTPKRRRTVAESTESSDDSDVMSKPRKRKHCKMRIEDSDDDETYHTLPTTMPDPTEPRDSNYVDSERKNKDIIDILQNDQANESNENLPAPQTPTSLPVNMSQDAAYEEIDSRLQLMFASPKPADKTSTASSLLVANQVKTQLLPSTLMDGAVATCVTGNDMPPETDLRITKVSVGDTKPPADFSVTDTFLSDISANSFLASDVNVTINETNHSGVNATSSFSDSNVSTKHISLGSSDYRFEKVSENVVNLFITRKRRGKRKLTTAVTTTNTVSAT